MFKSKPIKMGGTGTVGEERADTDLQMPRPKLSRFAERMISGDYCELRI